MSVFMFVVCLSLILALFGYVQIRFKKQNSINKSYGEIQMSTLGVFEKSSDNIVDIAKSLEAVTSEVTDLNKDNGITKVVCTELINSNDRLQSAVKKLIEADGYNKEKISVLATSFKNKAAADKKLMESLKSFLNKDDVDWDDEPPSKKILN